MSTINSKDIIKQMLENDGTYPGDPQVWGIYSYTNQYGKRTYKLIYTLGMLGEFLSSPFCRSILKLWDKEEGLTEHGRKFLEENKDE